MARKSGLTLREEIVLHLQSLGRFETDIEGPYAATREGMSQALGIKPSQLSRDLQPLISSGGVEWNPVHVLGFRKRVRAYRLTEEGMKRAQRIIDSLKNVSVTFVDEFGNAETSTLEKAVKRMGRRHGYLDLLRMRSADGEGQIIAASPTQLPRPERFVGRVRELGSISGWHSDKSSSTLVVYGIAGVGKTSLVMRFAGLLKEVPKFYFKLHEWDTVRGFLEVLGNALAGMGDERLQSYLRNRPYEDLSNVSLIIRDALSSQKPLLIIDDVWAASRSMAHLMTLLCEAVAESREKMVLISREFPSSLEGGSNARGSITKLRLEGLSDSEARELLEFRGVSKAPKDRIDELINALKGHPLLLAMLQGTEDAQALYEGDIARFIHGEIISRLSLDEKRLLNLLAVLRYPVPASLLVKRFGYELVESLQRKALIERPGQTATIHDLMRSFSLASMSEAERKECHLIARGILMPSGSYVIERAYHALSSGMIDDALQELGAERDGLIRTGHAPQLLVLLDQLPQQELSPRMSREVVLTRTMCFAHLGDITKAIECYEKAPKDISEDPEVMLVAADDYVIEGVYEKAQHLLTALKGRRMSGQLALETERVNGRLLVAQGMFDQAKRAYARALALARKGGSKEMVAEVLMDLGTIAIYREDSKEATRYLLDAMKFLRGSEYALGRVYLNLSIAYFQRTMYEPSLTMLERALEIYKRSGDYISVLKLMINKSAIFYETERMEEARQALIEALELARRSGIQRFIAAAMANLSMTDNMLGNHNEAEALAKEALRTAEVLKDSRLVVSIKNSLALSALGQRRVDDAISLAKESLALSEKLGTHGMSVDALETLSDSYLARRDRKKALMYAKRSLSIARERGIAHSIKRIEKLVEKLKG